MANARVHPGGPPPKKLESNLGPKPAESQGKRWGKLQNNTKRANKIRYRGLPVTQEVASSSLVGPANALNDLRVSVSREIAVCATICDITAPKVPEIGPPGQCREWGLAWPHRRGALASDRQSPLKQVYVLPAQPA